jgi:type II secretory pathway pseudopilin PulG
MRMLSRRSGATRGSTLVELMVATVILSIGILGLFGAFRFISRSIFVSRGQTLANNLAQERIEYLKNVNYYALQLTTATATDNSFTPGIDYDTGNYPPETISIAGISFTRYTYVGMVQVDNDLISDVSSSYPDTGMKQISVYIVWTDNGTRKKWVLKNLLENPYVNPLDATLTGTISKAAGGALQGAIVSVEQNPDWNATTDASGLYTFKVYHGTYSVRASSSGYYDSISSAAVVAKGNSKNFSMSLVQIASGSVAGIAWFNPDVVFSQVVAATQTDVANGGRAEVEYFELFNPTTYPINIGINTGTFPQPVNFFYYDEDTIYYRFIGWFNANPNTAPTQLDWTHMVYTSTFVPSGSYYTVANSSYFCVNNNWIRADAYYYDFVNPDYPDIVRNDKAGGLYMYRYPNAAGYPTDVIGWNDNDNTAPVYDGSPIPDMGSGHDGLTPGYQVVRVSSPGINSADIGYYGRAYDSDYNSRDWLYPTNGGPSFFYTPYTVSRGTFPVISGKPAAGVFVSASDYNSGSTITVTNYISSAALSLPYSKFRLNGVSTGTWDVVLAGNTNYPFYQNLSQTVSNVAVSQGLVTSIPNGTTVSPWSAANKYAVQVTSSTSLGFVRGQVTNGTGVPLSNITITGGGNNKLTGSNGLYFMSVTSGTVVLVANPNNLNGAYISNTQTVTVSSQAVTTQNFSLSLGGRLQGYATSGSTPLSNVVFVALNSGSQAGTATTDASGVFNIRNISTGTYTVQPVLEVGQDVNPNSRTAVMTTTGTLFVDTFTVTGAFGNITGTVSDASGFVTSGALLVASTSSISSTPPSVVGSSAPAMTPYYMVSSKADGTYTMPVRGSNTYYISVYVPIISGASVSITTKTYSNVYVSPSGATTKNVTIP